MTKMGLIPSNFDSSLMFRSFLHKDLKKKILSIMIVVILIIMHVNS